VDTLSETRHILHLNSLILHIDLSLKCVISIDFITLYTCTYILLRILFLFLHLIVTHFILHRVYTDHSTEVTTGYA